MAITLQELQIKAATDEKFRAALVRDPRGTLATQGVELPDDVEVEIIGASRTTLPIVIPRPSNGEITEEALKDVAGGGLPVVFIGSGGA